MNPTNKVIDAVKLSEANILEELGKMRELLRNGNSKSSQEVPLSLDEVARDLVTKSIEDALRETPVTRGISVKTPKGPEGSGERRKDPGKGPDSIPSDPEESGEDTEEDLEESGPGTSEKQDTQRSTASDESSFIDSLARMKTAKPKRSQRTQGPAKSRVEVEKKQESRKLVESREAGIPKAVRQKSSQTSQSQEAKEVKESMGKLHSQLADLAKSVAKLGEVMSLAVKTLGQLETRVNEIQKGQEILVKALKEPVSSKSTDTSSPDSERTEASTDKDTGGTRNPRGSKRKTKEEFKPINFLCGSLKT